MKSGEVSARIREKRKEQRLTQQELADKVGVSLMTVLRWEKGERSPRLEEMNKLAEALKVSASYFMGEDDTAPMTMKDEQTSERKQNMAMLTLENGKRVEAPATPEGYAFLERLYTLSLRGQAPVMA